MILYSLCLCVSFVSAKECVIHHWSAAGLGRQPAVVPYACVHVKRVLFDFSLLIFL